MAEKTVVMPSPRASSPSYVAFDDRALRDLEAAARLVGTAHPVDPTAGNRANARAYAPAYPGSVTRRTMPPVRESSRATVAALVAGGLVAVVTGATLLFYFVVP